MTNGEKNFIESKDNVYHNFPTNCFLHGTLIIFCAVSILLYVFKVEYKLFQGTFFGFVFAVVVAALDIINVLAKLCFSKKYQHAYYGVCVVLISLCLNYFAVCEGMYPFDQLYGLLAVGIWIITALFTVYAIIDNIKNDRYNYDGESIYFFKDQPKNQNRDSDGKKYGIVITKHTIIIAAIYVIAAIGLISVYFTNKDLFEESGKLIIDYSHVGLICATFFLSCSANFGWKLIVKQYYQNKMNKSIKR